MGCDSLNDIPDRGPTDRRQIFGSRCFQWKHIRVIPGLTRCQSIIVINCLSSGKKVRMYYFYFYYHLVPVPESMFYFCVFMVPIICFDRNLSYIMVRGNPDIKTQWLISDYQHTINRKLWIGKGWTSPIKNDRCTRTTDRHDHDEHSTLQPWPQEWSKKSTTHDGDRNDTNMYHRANYSQRNYQSVNIHARNMIYGDTTAN